MANYLNISGKSSVAGGGRLPKLRGQIVPVVAEAAATTLVDTDSGSVVLIGDNDAVTLPAAKSGVYFTFIVSTAPTTSSTVTAAGAAKIKGSIIAGGADHVADTSAVATIVTFVGNSAAVGDSVNIVSDGTDWLITGGIGSVAAGVTLS